MKVFVVTLESKDKHRYSYMCNAVCERDAVISAHGEIMNKGWEHYLYVPVKIEIINSGVCMYNIGFESADGVIHGVEVEGECKREAVAKATEEINKLNGADHSFVVIDISMCNKQDVCMNYKADNNPVDLFGGVEDGE